MIALDNNNMNNNLDNRIGNNISLVNNNNRSQVNGDYNSLINSQRQSLLSNSRNEYNPREVLSEENSFNVLNEKSFNYIPNIIERDIEKFITLSTYTIVSNLIYLLCKTW